MAYVADLVILAVIVLSTVLGYRRGLVKTMFKCLTFVAAVLAAYTFGSAAGEYIQTTSEYEKVEVAVNSAVDDFFDKKAEESLGDAKKAQNGLEDSEIGKILSKLGVDSRDLLEKYEAEVLDGKNNLKESFVKKISDGLLKRIALVVGTIAVFAASLLLLKLASKLVEALFKLPLLKNVNKGGGALLGLVLGFVYAFAICAIVEMLLPYIPDNPVVYMGMEENTVVYRFFLNLNPILFLFFG